MSFLEKNKWLKWAILALAIVSVGFYFYKNSGYQKTEKGLQYKFLQGKPLKEIYGPENYCLVQYMIIGPNNDTIENSFHSDTLYEIPYPVEPRNELMEGLQMASPGSTIEVLIPTDSLKAKIAGTYKIKLLPDKQMAKFVVHVEKILNTQEYEAYVNQKVIARAMAENKLIDDYCAAHSKEGTWYLDSLQSIRYRFTENGKSLPNKGNCLSDAPIRKGSQELEFDVVVSTLKGDLVFDSRLEGRKYKAAYSQYLNGLRVLDELPFHAIDGVSEFVTTSIHGFGGVGRIGVPTYAPLYVKIYNVKELKRR